MATPDMEVIKEIPGYKVILKAVLKYQIQHLVEMLASSTDEESVILTASVTDGTLSHLGSESGKVFLEDHDDVKSQFLGFCLKRHHKKKQSVIPTSTPPRPSFNPKPKQNFGPRSASPMYSGPSPSSYRASLRHEPYPLSKPIRSNSFESTQAHPDSSKSSIVKQEPMDSDNFSTMTGSQDLANISAETTQDSNQSSDGTLPNTPVGHSGDNINSESELDPNISVKSEHVPEDLEITGVQPGSNSGTSQDDNWAPENDPSLLYNSTGSADFSASGIDYNVKLELDLQNYTMNHSESDASLSRDIKRTHKRNFECTECGKSFKDRWQLKTHFRVHTGEKPFECDICHRSFSTKAICKNHRFTHLKLNF